MASDKNLQQLKNRGFQEIEELEDFREQRESDGTVKRTTRRQFRERESRPHRNTHAQNGNKKVKGL